MDEKRTYIAIDLKSFYASVECKERGKDPLDYCLVVADESRSDKTICLAVSPPLKSFGLPGRARLFEAKEMLRKINEKRRESTKYKRLKGKSRSLKELEKYPDLEIDFEAAKPRMALYIEYSRRIYGIYLRYVSEEDIHVYSIDEVFIDATPYLKLYGLDAHDFAMRIILDVLNETGITATAGIGTNLYLAKVAMDIMAKHIKADENGVRIASLDEREYRKKLWSHTPLTDFWRIGRGYQKRLNDIRLYTMEDIALCSIGDDNRYHNEDLLYKTFGKNAELLIDHAWGCESCTMKDIKAYRSKSSSLSSGQVLQRPYEYEEALIVLNEMADSLSLDLLKKGLKTRQIVLYIGYDTENLKDENRKKAILNGIRKDYLGRDVPMYAHASLNLEERTSSSFILRDAFCVLFRAIANPALLIRRINLTASDVKHSWEKEDIQLDLFQDMDEKMRGEKECEKEQKLLLMALNIKERYGKNSLIRGISFLSGATARERNIQIGGHLA